MRRSKVRWTWGFGNTANDVVFLTNGRIKAERTGYTAQDAETFCAYLNSRG